jgi:hypothetical protein
MESSCPFMAIHSAMDKSKESDSARKGKGSIPLACPMSGRKAVLDQNHGFRNIGSSEEESEEDDAYDLKGKGDGLGVIPEDMETPETPLGDTSPRASLAGSMRSLRSVSQIGSVASGINVNIPAGSRSSLVVSPPFAVSTLIFDQALLGRISSSHSRTSKNSKSKSSK